MRRNRKFVSRPEKIYWRISFVEARQIERDLAAYHQRPARIVVARWFVDSFTRGEAGSGGGTANARTATLTNCTVSANAADEGGGLDNFDEKTLKLTDTIVAGNWEYLTKDRLAPDAKIALVGMLRREADRDPERCRQVWGSTERVGSWQRYPSWRTPTARATLGSSPYDWTSRTTISGAAGTFTRAQSSGRRAHGRRRIVE